MTIRKQRGRTPESTIVVTGLGVISAAGACPESLWNCVKSGRSPAILFRDPLVDASPSIPACVVPEAYFKDIPLKRYQRMDRSVQMALNAATQAFADAGLHDQDFASTSIGVAVGTSRGPIQKSTEIAERHLRGKPIAPCSSAHTTIGCASGAIAFALGARGPSFTISATCASGAHAIILAAEQILLGNAEIMLAGGAEAPLQDAVVQQMIATGVLGSHVDPAMACRPFDHHRNGTMLGEGAAFLVLESLASATRRRATIHAVLAGWATGTDCFHETSPSTQGEALVNVMHRALCKAELTPEDLGSINLHGTGTVMNDSTEAAAVQTLLGKHISKVLCSSTKPMTGHCLGAVAALEALVAVLSLKNQSVPPLAGLVNVDPECRLNLAIGQAQRHQMEAVLSNSVGFWGNNAAIAFTQS